MRYGVAGVAAIAALGVGVVGVVLAKQTRTPSAPSASSASSSSGDGATEPARAVTFAHDIAPLVYAKCSSCHHAGGAGPFPLLTYDDVVEHATDIARVTKTRFMPPWKPIAEWGAFAEDRSLSPEQLATLQRWLHEGKALGDARAVPKAPTFDDGWQLGVPDVVVELPEPYPLAAEGSDVYRNFVIPPVVDRPRFVNAWELRPGTKVIHHAILNVDRLGLARAKDAKDPGLGFGGLDVGDVQSADGLFLVWTPGWVPAPRSAETAWRIDAHTDLVLQLHMQPTGKAETVRPKLALYFTDVPPTQKRFTLRIGDPAIDIAPGDAHYVVKSDYELPADVAMVSVFPHAHYLARTMRAWATMPDGSERRLLRIDDWDFAWQDQYVFAEPVLLPAGAKLHMEFAYDNSAANPRNPSRPPRRVVTGERSIDEMGNLTFEVIPATPNGMVQLRVSRYRLLLAGNEASARNHYNLANALSDLGQKDEAITQLRRAIELDPQLPPAHFNLSLLLSARGDTDGAVTELKRALAAKPDYADAHVNLANILSERGHPDEALVHYRAAVTADPSSALAHASLGLAYYEKKQLEAAATELEASLQIDPKSWVVHYHLGNVRRDQQQTAAAIAQYTRSLELRPDAREPRAALAALDSK